MVTTSSRVGSALSRGGSDAPFGSPYRDRMVSMAPAGFCFGSVLWLIWCVMMASMRFAAVMP